MRRSLAILVAMFVAGAAAVHAQPAAGGESGHARFMPRGAHQMMQKLNLSDKQKADAAKLHTELEKSMVGIQSRIKLARIDLRTLVTAEAPDRSAVEAKLKEISDLQYQEKKLVADHVFDFYALLTPEQQKTARAGLMHMLANGGMRWRGRMMRDGGGMMGGGGRMMPDGGGMMGGRGRMNGGDVRPDSPHAVPDEGGTNH